MYLRFYTKLSSFFRTEGVWDIDMPYKFHHTDSKKGLMRCIVLQCAHVVQIVERKKHFSPVPKRRNAKCRNSKNARIEMPLYPGNQNHRKTSKIFFEYYTGMLDTRWIPEVRPRVSFPPKFLWNSLSHRNFNRILDSYSFVPNDTIGIFTIEIISSKILIFFPLL